MKRFALTAIFLSLAAAACLAAAPRWRPVDQAKNVILLIPDGCPVELPAAARLATGRPLALDPHLAGMVRTHSADSLVTDSAAAATAMACGVKTANGAIGVSAPSDARKYGGAGSPALAPLPTLAEAAKRSGRAVGLVATSNINDATPAAFAAHTITRKAGAEIITQMVHQDIDVALGGGASWMVPAERGGRRTDGADLFEVLAARGACVATNREELAAASSTPLWGFFARDRISPAIDRAVGGSDEPSLREMTRKAIDLLKQSPEGFFLMVEGSQIDWACHANDTAWAISEFLEFDAACSEALRFAAGEGRGATLVVVCADHGTGGLSIGREYAGSIPRDFNSLLGPLGAVRRSSFAMGRDLGDNRDPADVAAQMRAWWGIRLGEDGMAELSRLLSLGMNTGFAIAETGWRFGTPGIGWTTHGHTGTDVQLWSFGPGRPTGCIDNTKVNAAIAKAMGIDLARLRDELYADLEECFPGEVEIACDEESGAPLFARVRGVALRFNSDEMTLQDGTKRRAGGLALYIPQSGRAYAPQAAIKAIRASGK